MLTKTKYLALLRLAKALRHQSVRASPAQANSQKRKHVVPLCSLAVEVEVLSERSLPLSLANPEEIQQRSLKPSSTAQLCGSYLRELYIRDFALVKEQRVTLHPGLNVVSGESGSGKSVLVSALGQIIGLQAPENCIRAPARVAILEGRLHLSASTLDMARRFFRSHNLPEKIHSSMKESGSEFLLRREIAQGEKAGTIRSRSFINGVAVGQRVLREFGALFVDVNGQLAAQSLRDSDSQVALLDELAGTERLANSFGRKLSELHQVQAELRALDELGDETARSHLEQMVQRIESHHVRAGEEIYVKARLRQLDSLKTNLERCALVCQEISGGNSGGVGELLANLQSSVRTILSQEQAQNSLRLAPAGDSDSDEESPSQGYLTSAFESLQQARRCVTSAERQIGNYANQVECSEQENDRLRQRLGKLTKLLRHYRCGSSEELLQVAEKARLDLEHWQNSEGSRDDKERLRESLQGRLAAQGSELSRKRKEVAGRLRVAVEASLADLAMAGSRFDIRIGWEQAAQSQSGIPISEELAAHAYESAGKAYAASSDGFDRVEYLLAAGPSEPLRPLGAVASGGERSRIMLALKAAPPFLKAGLSNNQAEADHGNEAATNAVLVLDELDSGVGGRLGAPVGKLLHRMASSSPSNSTQILCVSHLPQVAAYADHHICVRKQADGDGRLTTHFVLLANHDEKSQEIAAMGGIRIEEAFNMMAAAVQ